MPDQGLTAAGGDTATQDQSFKVDAVAKAMCDADKLRRPDAEYAQSWADSPEGYWRDHWRAKARDAMAAISAMADVQQAVPVAGELGPLWRNVQKVQTDAMRHGWTVEDYRTSMAASLGLSGRWLSIESAPRDATIIDVWAGGKRWTQAYWGRRDHFSRSPWGEEGWQHCGDILPGHWMPQPSSPLTEPARKADRLGEGVGVEIPDGMKPWHGGNAVPDDWDGGLVFRRALGLVEQLETDDPAYEWLHHPHGRLHDLDIIAYTPRSALPDPTHTREAVDVRKLVTDALHDHQLGNRAGIRDRLIADISAALSAGSAQ